MLIASRDATMVGGILGGSGSHPALIIIGIVVVAALITFSVTFFLPRRGLGGGEPAAPRDSARAGAAGSAVGEATLRLSRTWAGNPISGVLSGRNEEWNIALDGKVVGAIAYQETVEVAMAPGHHTLRLGQGRHISQQGSFEVADHEAVSYQCNGPRFWPRMLAAQFRPDLWITLRRS
jgi:hypothetical protein